MIYEIKPLLGVNNIRLGQTRDEVIQLLGEPESAEKRSDCYFSAIFQVHYNREGLVNFIEVYEDNTISALLGGKDIFRTTKSKLRYFIEDNFKGVLDDNDAEYPCSHTYKRIGVGFWSDMDPSELTKDEVLQYPEGYKMSHYFKSIGIGDKNYYT